VRPAIGLLRRQKLVAIGQRAVALRGVLRRVTQRDMGLAGDHGGAGRGLGLRQRAVDILGVVAVAFEHVPARGREARHLVGAVGERDLAVDGDPVVVPQHDQARQFLPPASASASWLTPSIRQPSPAITQVR
jgi:hypothetical protein